MARVRLRGVLDEAPIVKAPPVHRRRPGEDGQFCEVAVRINDWRMPVRFEGRLALLVGGYLPETQIALRGELRRYQWEGANGRPNERIVVLCTQIDSLQAPDNRIKVRTLDN